MENVVIRIAQQRDLAEILDLYKVLLGEDIDYEKALFTFNKIDVSANTHILVAEIHNRVVGTVQASICMGIGFDCRPFATIEYLVVKEDCRNKGIGSALLRQIDDIAKKENCAFTFLVSSEKWKDAHKLYYKCGYTEDVIGFRKGYGENNI